MKIIRMFIENVKLAMLDLFWFGDPHDMPTENPVWCGIRIRYEPNSIKEVENSFLACYANLKIETNTRHCFPGTDCTSR